MTINLPCKAIPNKDKSPIKSNILCLAASLSKVWYIGFRTPFSGIEKIG